MDEEHIYFMSETLPSAAIYIPTNLAYPFNASHTFRRIWTPFNSTSNGYHTTKCKM